MQCFKSSCASSLPVQSWIWLEHLFRVRVQETLNVDGPGRWVFLCHSSGRRGSCTLEPPTGDVFTKAWNYSSYSLY